MIRDIDEKQITPDKLMSSSDMAKLGCNDCAGCSQCCRDRAAGIVLDKYDVALLKESLNYSFEGLLNAGLVDLRVIDGVVLPTLGTKNKTEECIFLNENGRCSIHDARPGICRMFPLARIYNEDGSFSYFIQEGECERRTGVKIKISKWLGYPDIKGYEKAVREYHDKLVDVREKSRDLSAEERGALQKAFLVEMFL